MPWKAIPEFGCWSTNFPQSWMEQLQFSTSYVTIRELIVEKNELLATDSVLIADFKKSNPPLLEKRDKKKIIRNLERFDLLGELRNVPHVEVGLRTRMSERELRLSTFRAKQQEAKSRFDAELREKREKLWAFANQNSFQHGLLELSPDFLELIKRYAQTPDIFERERNSQLRRNETSLFSYITRFCTKSAVCGSSGTTSSASMDDLQESLVSLKQNPPKRKAFLSHRCAQSMAKAWLQDIAIFKTFPIYLHSTLSLEGPTLRSLSWFANPDMPDQERIEVSFELADLFSKSTADIHIQDLSETVLSELKTLHAKKFVFSTLEVPVGCLEPLVYWKACLQEHATTDSLQHMRASILSFENILSEFESHDLGRRQKAFAQAEEAYAQVTGETSQKEGGKYYDDRFILFLDEYNGVHYTFSRKRFEYLLDSYAFALELMAPFWLWSIAKADLFLKKRVHDILVDIDEKSTAQSKMVDIGKVYLDILQGKIPVADIQDVPAFETWAKNVQELMKLRSALLQKLDLTSHCVSFSDQDADVLAYRQAIKRIMSSQDHALPLYASCAIFQVALEEGREKIVFDSTVFGNCMNLMIVNALSLNMDKQKGHTAEAIRSMLLSGDTEFVHPTLRSGQGNKFSPWIFPFIDLRFLGDSYQTDKSKKANLDGVIVSAGEAFIHDEYNDKNKKISFLYPATTRISRKLIFDQDTGPAYTHIPRLELGDVVLQRETWFEKGPWLSERLQFDSQDPFGSFFRAVELQTQRNLPQQIFIECIGGEKNILIDFSNFFSIELLFLLLKNTETVKICEALPKVQTKSRIEKEERSASFTLFAYYEPKNIS